MNKLSILFLFSFSLTFGQRQIQHEPERIFNTLNEGKTTIEYAKEKNLKKITFLRDTELSSSIEFDKNGNFIKTVGMENSSVRHSTYQWDELNRMIEKNTSHQMAHSGMGITIVMIMVLNSCIR